ncbi:MAG: hypothetical protein DCC75_12150 [Proteobacteria bacterium]|nr:MAG: hypothetical protein DCC75_12150 [Pseudomonadota bacterium]
MVVLSLLYASSTLVLLGLLHQFLMCWRGLGLFREGNALRGVPGTYEISSFRWAINAIANVMWIVYGFSLVDNTTMPVLVICFPYLLLDALILLAILMRPPRRPALELAAVRFVLLASLSAALAAAAVSELLQAHRQILVWLPVIATALMTALGRLAQIRILVRDRKRGKLSLWECLLSMGDASLWFIYGLALPKWEIWMPCLIVTVLDLIRWFLFITARKE